MVFIVNFVKLVTLCILLVEFNEANSQGVEWPLFNRRDGAYSSQYSRPSGYKQGSIEEFLAIRTTTERYNKPHEPCVPQQFHPRRNRRSPHFQKRNGFSVYPVNIYEQNIQNVVPIVNAAKPPYYHYGGYYCGDGPMRKPVHNNNFPHFANLFNGILGINSNVLAASPPAGSDVRPVHEESDHANAPTEIDRWKPGKPVGGIQNTVNGYHQDLSNQKPNRFVWATNINNN